MHISEVVLIQGGRDAKACAAGTHDNRGYPHLWRYCCECPGSRHPTNSRWSDDAAANQDDYHRYHGGMMGGGMMGRGMMGQGYGRGIMGPMAMRIIFSLMDADGDGKLTLQEWQAAHERIFKAMDTDHDGTVTLEEMQAFMRGH